MRELGVALNAWFENSAPERGREEAEDRERIQALNALSAADKQFARHCEHDHVVFRRDCAACLAGHVRGHGHFRRKHQHTNALTLNVDMIGPLCPSQHEGGTAKHLLVGVFGVPLYEDGRPQYLEKVDSGEPRGDSDFDFGLDGYHIPPEWVDDAADDGAGVDAPGDWWENGYDDHDRCDDAGVVAEGEAEEDGDPLEPDPSVRERSHERWKATIAQLKKPVKIVPVVYVQPLPRKSAAVVLKGLQRMHTAIKMHGMEVRRIHADNGREFQNEGVEAWCVTRDIGLTFSVPGDPRSNGRVEQVVGACKAGVRSLLCQGGIGKEWWARAALHWADSKRRQAFEKLGSPVHAREQPPFGTKVTVRSRHWNQKNPFEPKTLKGVALGPSERTPGATVVLIKHKGKPKLYIAPLVYRGVRDPPEFEAEEAPEPAPEPRRRICGKTSVANLSIGLESEGESTAHKTAPRCPKTEPSEPFKKPIFGPQANPTFGAENLGLPGYRFEAKSQDQWQQQQSHAS